MVFLRNTGDAEMIVRTYNRGLVGVQKRMGRRVKKEETVCQKGRDGVLKRMRRRVEKEGTAC